MQSLDRKALIRRLISRLMLCALAVTFSVIVFKQQKQRNLAMEQLPQKHSGAQEVVVPQGVPHTFNTFVFNTPCSFIFTGDKEKCAASAREAMALCRKVNDVLNRFDPESEISRFNAAPADTDFACSELFMQALLAAKKAYGDSRGCFDVTVAPLLNYWKKGGTGNDEEFAKLKAATGFNGLQIFPETRIIRKTHAGTQLDFGGLAKGFALDLVKDIADAPHIEEALVNLGGNLYLRQKADSPFAGEVAIRCPFGGNIPAATVTNCNGRFISTSSFAERGRHIVHPATGKPAESAFASVTAVTAGGSDSDVFSTSVFIGGRELAESLVQNNPGTAFALITSKDKAPELLGDIALKQTDSQ